MKRKPLAVKAAAIFSSLALLTVYVSCRTDDSPKSDAGEPPAKQSEPTLMPGSKSERVVQPPKDQPKSQQTIMGGSKSLAPIVHTPAQQPK